MAKLMNDASNIQTLLYQLLKHVVNGRGLYMLASSSPLGPCKELIAACSKFHPAEPLQGVVPALCDAFEAWKPGFPHQLSSFASLPRSVLPDADEEVSNIFPYLPNTARCLQALF